MFSLHIFAIFYLFYPIIVMKTNAQQEESQWTRGSPAVSYRFRCPGPGLFHCALTGLVFKMIQGAELLYRPVQWDETLLQSVGKMPAGLLFDIKCSEDAVRELHLPHCETKDALLVDGLLSVVHIGDDGMSIFKSLEITATHVVVEVPHLSAFGLVWDIIKRFLPVVSQAVNGQVLLFLRPPLMTLRVLDVFVLQDNVPVHEVAAQQGDAEYIKISSDCALRFDHSYSVHCEPEGFTIQPECAKFHSKCGPNFHPTFEVFLEENPEKVTLMVQDAEKKDVWKRRVLLAGPRRELPRSDVPPEEKLLAVRTEFINRVSEPVLKQLLDRLLECAIINDEEMQSLSSPTKVKADKARDMIDMVRKKGTEACSVLISALCDVDPCLSTQLNFR